VEKFQNFKKLVNKKLVEMYNETKELFLADNLDVNESPVQEDNSNSVIKDDTTKPKQVNNDK